MVIEQPRGTPPALGVWCHDFKAYHPPLTPKPWRWRQARYALPLRSFVASAFDRWRKSPARMKGIGRSGSRSVSTYPCQIRPLDIFLFGNTNWYSIERRRTVALSLPIRPAQRASTPLRENIAWFPLKPFRGTEMSITGTFRLSFGPECLSSIFASRTRNAGESRRSQHRNQWYRQTLQLHSTSSNNKCHLGGLRRTTLDMASGSTLDSVPGRWVATTAAVEKTAWAEGSASAVHSLHGWGLARSRTVGTSPSQARRWTPACSSPAFDSIRQRRAVSFC